MTQQHLADLADVSLRTVRGLETDQISSPHFDSVRRLAAALALDHADRRSFLAAWGFDDRSSFSEVADLFGDTDDAAALRAAVRANAASTDQLSVSTKIRLGNDRRIEFMESRLVVVARIDGVVGRTHISEAVSASKVDLIEMVDLENSVVLRERALPRLRAKAFDVGFGRTLLRGQIHAYQYRVDYRQANSTTRFDRDVPTPIADHAGSGSYRTTPLHHLEVWFDADDPPARCEQIFRARPGDGGRIVALGDVPLNRWATAQLILQNARPGLHGLRWTW